ncbi:MAG: ATP-binding cassette domain-containing protein [Eggerthellaceae bacterium]|nr:ATP-binding cassette domain-containing protein [Eggerthellaceae bacterium]
MRHLMGFSRPDEGTSSILGRDYWKYAARLHKNIGYLPGEIAFPTNMNGSSFLRMMEKMRGIKNDENLARLLKIFELDPHISTHDMSLGVKRKLAVVVAFMHDPNILILDKPTSGLDPIMQQTFIDFVIQEKTRGKTIFLSSHLFNEMDATCDRIAIIRKGHLVSVFKTQEFKERGERFYRITFGNESSYEQFNTLAYEIAERNPKAFSAKIHLNDSDINSLLKDGLENKGL